MKAEKAGKTTASRKARVPLPKVAASAKGPMGGSRGIVADGSGNSQREWPSIEVKYPVGDLRVEKRRGDGCDVECGGWLWSIAVRLGHCARRE